MLVKEAKVVAQRWVEEEAEKLSGYVGAFIFGSVNWMTDTDPLPRTSDFDIRIVLDVEELPPSYIKFDHQGLLIETSYTNVERVQSPEAVLAHYPTAAHFTRPCILSDPTGLLNQIQAAVQKEFAKRKWVQARVENAKNWQLSSLDWLDKSEPFHDQVFVWSYAASIFNHIILVADLKNPTVRKMQITACDVLNRYGQLEFHEHLLRLFGAHELSRQQVEHLLEKLTEVFEIAKALDKPNFFGVSSIREEGRSPVLTGITEMIENGYPREAGVWLLQMHIFCQKILYAEAQPDIQTRYMPYFDDLMSSLGVKSLEDVYQRIEQVKALRPQAAAIADIIMERNPDIID